MLTDEMVKRTYDMMLDLVPRVVRIEERMEGIDKRVTRVEDDVETTGNHDWSRLERELEERKRRDSERAHEQRAWISRNWIGIVIAVGVVLLSTGCSMAGTLVLKKVFGV